MLSNGGILYLTVNGDGRLSLWDSAMEAVAGKESGETCVQLSLTAEQMRTVLRAQAAARELKRGSHA